MERINKTQQERASRNYGEDATLIREGGYRSPSSYLMQDIEIALTLGKPILLKGPAGAGKTKLAETLSHTFGQPMQSINTSVDLDAEALLGFKTIVQKEGRAVIEFVEGPVVQAMKKGHLLYIDEINMAKAETLPILHGLLDYRRMLTNPFTGEVIKAHPHFGVIAAINEGYMGTTPLNEALKDRFVSFSIPYIEGKELEHLLVSIYPSIDESTKTSILSITKELRILAEQGRLADEAASIRSLFDVADLSFHMPLLRAYRYGLVEKMSDTQEKELVYELVQTWIEE
ncbi:AAA family ATPase [Chryseomicrobium palamuruense]|uniref:AAA family ATPase n=1 Tax=Chryseomicrobium palamuruense TaxID=682973 RepID=A0ABV8UVW0_9BACL